MNANVTSEMGYKLVRITPKLAKFYLASNTTNRPVRKNWVHQLAEIIKLGAWQITHQGIAFDTKGNLQDGQHRLMAIIEADIPVDMYVATGTPEKAFTVIDQGVKRSVGDVLRVIPCVAAGVNKIATMLSNYKKPSIDLLEKTNEVFGDKIKALYDFAPSNVRVYAGTYMRIGAVARLAAGGDEDYIFKTYRAMATVNIEEMPPIGKSFVSQVSRGEVQTSGANYDYLSRCYYIFDKTRANSSKLVLRNVLAVHQEMIDALRQEFERHYPS